MVNQGSPGQSHHFTRTEGAPSHQSQHSQVGSEPHIRQFGFLKATWFDISVTALLQTAVYSGLGTRLLKPQSLKCTRVLP